MDGGVCKVVSSAIVCDPLTFPSLFPGRFETVQKDKHVTFIAKRNAFGGETPFFSFIECTSDDIGIPVSSQVVYGNPEPVVFGKLVYVDDALKASDEGETASILHQWLPGSD